MSYRYYPYSEHICHHVYNKGGCTFCGFHLMKNCVSPTPVPIKQQIKHFDEFVSNEKNYQDILKQDRILVESNGSWFVEIPEALRRHIYSFIESQNLELHTQCRADLIKKEETRDTIDAELKPYMLIFTGLEVADNSDLKLINKGCELDDYVAFSKFVRSRNAKIGANVLIAPPLVQDPIRKALKTAQFAFEILKASEVAFCCCIPRLGTKGHSFWRQGRWNPISATESSEIYWIIKNRYPEKRVSLYMARVHNFHGKYSGQKIKTDAQKAIARKKVRKIAQEVFGS